MGGCRLVGQSASCPLRYGEGWGAPSQEEGLFLFWSRSPFPMSCLLGRPCTCHPAGSLGTCDPRSGRCPCKGNVEGSLCDRWASPSGNKPVRSGLGAAGVEEQGAWSSQTQATPPPHLAPFREPMHLPPRQLSEGFITLFMLRPSTTHGS